MSRTEFLHVEFSGWSVWCMPLQPGEVGYSYDTSYLHDITSHTIGVEVSRQRCSVLNAGQTTPPLALQSSAHTALEISMASITAGPIEGGRSLKDDRTNQKHSMCTGQFLIVSRSQPGFERCVVTSVNNMIQQANVITHQSMMAFGHGQNGIRDRMDSMMQEAEAQKKSLPPIDLAGEVLAQCGWLKPYSGSQIFAEFGKDADLEAFKSMNPDSFIITAEVGELVKGKQGSPSPTYYVDHFEAVVNKSGDYWLVLGIDKAKPIYLGDLSSMMQCLFSEDGREETANNMKEQYKKGWGEVDVRIGQSEWRPIVLLPMLTTPSGWGASTYDVMENREEVLKSLGEKGDVCVRENLAWPKQLELNTVVQVIDLKNEDQRKQFTVDPSSKTLDHSNKVARGGKKRARKYYKGTR